MAVAKKANGLFVAEMATSASMGNSAQPSTDGVPLLGILLALHGLVELSQGKGIVSGAGLPNK